METGVTAARERLALQVCVAGSALVPLLAGGFGALGLAGIVGDGATSTHASHVRYLSGLLLAIGLGFWSTVPRIETHAVRFRLLTAIVAAGGLARLLGIVADGVPAPVMLGALAMELVITPLLCLWQSRIAVVFAGGDAAPP